MGRTKQRTETGENMEIPYFLLPITSHIPNSSQTPVWCALQRREKEPMNVLWTRRKGQQKVLSTDLNQSTQATWKTFGKTMDLPHRKPLSKQPKFMTSGQSLWSQKLLDAQKLLLLPGVVATGTLFSALWFWISRNPLSKSRKSKKRKEEVGIA